MKSAFLAAALIFSTLFFTAGNVHCQQTRSVVRQALVYAEPDAGSVVLDVLVAGMNVEVTGSQDGWTRVRVPGSAEVGWVQADRLGAESGAAIPGRSSTAVASSGLSEPQISVLRNRVSAMNGSLDRIEESLDRLVDRLQVAPDSMAREMTPAPFRVPEAVENGVPQFAVSGQPEFRWSNRFVMGKYFRGGEDLFGLAMSRSLVRGGAVALELETVYGVGDDRGQADDFIEWGLGLRYNIRNRTYWIYPFLEITLGMRHRVGDVAEGSGPLRYRVFSPGGGVKAELSEIFALEAASRAVYLYGEGERRSEGRITFSALFSY